MYRGDADLAGLCMKHNQRDALQPWHAGLPADACAVGKEVGEDLSVLDKDSHVERVVAMA